MKRNRSLRNVDIFAQREYTYTYEAGVLVRVTEYAVTFDESGFIVARSVVSTLRYFYNEQGTLVRKSVTFADGTEQVTLFDADEDNTTTRIRVNGEYISSVSKADAFGRKEFDELQLGGGFLSRKFSYLEGKITDEHRQNRKIKSAPTTHLVSRIDFSDGRSLSIKNGEGIIGYNYLPGADMKAGGLYLRIVARKLIRSVVVTVYCTWNDWINANHKYDSDKYKADLAKKIPFTNPTDYIIRISWTERFLIGGM